MLSSKKLFDSADGLAPETLYNALREAVLVVAKADPQLARERVAEEQHRTIALARACRERVHLDVRERRVLVNPVEVAEE